MYASIISSFILSSTNCLIGLYNIEDRNSNQTFSITFQRFLVRINIDKNRQYVFILVSSFVSYVRLWSVSVCPGNQVYKKGVSICIPTCGNQNPDSNPFAICDTLFGGCRCPDGLPYLADDGVTCTDSCEPGIKTLYDSAVLLLFG